MSKLNTTAQGHQKTVDLPGSDQYGSTWLGDMSALDSVYPKMLLF